MKAALLTKLNKEVGSMDGKILVEIFDELNINNFELTNGEIIIPIASVKDPVLLQKKLSEINTFTGRQFLSIAKNDKLIIPINKYKPSYGNFSSISNIQFPIQFNSAHTNLPEKKESQPIESKKEIVSTSSSESKAWYENSLNFTKCVNLAYEIIENYPNDRIFSLGQSPAWIVKSIEIISKKENKGIEIVYIPFSGRFYKDKTNSFSFHHSRVNTFSLDRSKRPEYESNYRKLLTNLGLDPETIINKAKKGQKTIILEYTQHGESLASFLSVLYVWASQLGCKKQLESSLQITLLKQEWNSLSTIFIPKDNISVSCDTILVDTSMIVPMANGLDSGPNSDRLVPRHPYWDWNKEPKLPKDNSKKITSIESELKDLIDKNPQKKLLF